MTLPERAPDCLPFIPTLPALDVAAPALLRRLCRRREPVALDLPDGPLPVRLTTPPARTSDAIALPLMIGEANACLHLSPQTLAPWAGEGWAALPAAWRGLLVEHALLAPIQRFEAHGGRPVRFVAQAPQRPLPVCIGLCIGAGQAWLELDETAAGLLADALDALPAAPRSLDGLPLPAVIEAGWQWLDLAELRSLRPGDVVMLERPAGGHRLRLAGRFQVACEHAGPAAIRLCAGFSPDTDPPLADSLFSPFMEPQPMDAPHDTPRTASLTDEALDRLPLQLACEIGRLDLPLGEVRTLGEGSVLALDRPLDEPVRLCVNGRCIGRGELVRLGDGLGVRLTSLAADE